MKNKMTNTSPKRSFTRAVAGTTFCTIGTLTDIIEMAEKIRAIAKQNPKTKAPEKRQPSLEEQAKERRYLFSVAFTRFEDALQTDVPTCAEEHSFNDYAPTCAEAARVLRLCRRFAEGLVSRVVTQPKERSRLGIALCGRTGTGKTHLASAIYHALKDEGTQPVYMRASTFFALFRGVPGNAEVKMITQLGRVSCLILDEIGRSALTPFEANKLQEVLDARARNGYPSILITNLQIDKLKDVLGSALASRIDQLFFPIACMWSDYRVKESAANLKPEEVF